MQKFFKEHPRRKEISQSDKIEILQLETRGKALEQEVFKRFNEHFDRLVKELDVQDLLPYLERHHVLSEEDVLMVSDESLDKSHQNRAMLELVKERPAFWAVKFTECMKETGKYKELLELLLPPSGTRDRNRVLLIKSSCKWSMHVLCPHNTIHICSEQLLNHHPLFSYRYCID